LNEILAQRSVDMPIVNTTDINFALTLVNRFPCPLFARSLDLPKKRARTGDKSIDFPTQRNYFCAPPMTRSDYGSPDASSRRDTRAIRICPAADWTSEFSRLLQPRDASPTRQVGTVHTL
jgi:hypothetical protein